jgi:hypothetical protein
MSQPDRKLVLALMKTAVETIFAGRERAYNRRFLQMCSHYLVDPVARTPCEGRLPRRRIGVTGNVEFT